MNARQRLSCAAAGVLAAIAPLGAQSTGPLESARHSMWLVYSGDHALPNGLGLVFDAQVRVTQNADRRRQLLLRPGASFAVNRHVKLSAGYTMVGARDDGSDPLAPRKPEHRAWASAQLAHSLGPVSLGHRYRLEHRWLAGVNVDETGARIDETYVSAERMRYGLRASVPLAPPGRASDVYLAASDEVFASFGGYAGSMAVDQNRAAVAIGMRASRTLRVEVGYMLQSSGEDGHLDERNHTLQVGLSSSAPLYRR